MLSKQEQPEAEDGKFIHGWLYQSNGGWGISLVIPLIDLHSMSSFFDCFMGMQAHFYVVVSVG